jgi:hypothetical protein
MLKEWLKMKGERENERISGGSLAVRALESIPSSSYP